MKKLFWGFFFIYLNFNLNLNQHTLNILPDFLGYILLLQGMKELDEESGLFRGARPFAIGMAVYTAILWVGALLGISSDGGWVSQLLSLIAMIVALYISWVLVQGILDMEQTKAADLNGGKLYQWWKGLVAVQVAARLLSLMADLENISILLALSTVLVIVGFVLIILYLMAWHRSTKAYEALPKRVAEGPEME